MRRLLQHKLTKFTSWLMLFVFTITFTPIDVFAQPVPEKQDPQLSSGLSQALSDKQLKRVREKMQEEKPKEDIRVLTSTEMKSITGRGEYRNIYFSGVAPWQRSFRDVNTSNGNLFKSFTDIQVAPAKGAGLVMQRTYNSNDDRVGPFGVGWTHAYDMRMEEAGNDNVDQTDSLGKKHTYKRDADGLYTPPFYIHSVLASSYTDFMVNGPVDVAEDYLSGIDGTVKHYVKDGNERVCDYIEDRHGNRTTLTYGLQATMPGGTTKNLLTEVTDPSGRSLTITWTDLNPSTHVWRITSVEGPSYDVTYEYYGTGDPNRAYNLWKVHLDPTGLNRTTTYDYTSVTGPNGTEYGLLSSITDPLGHSVYYTYTIPQFGLGKIWVTEINEPAGLSGRMVWTLAVMTYVGNEAVIHGFSSSGIVACKIQNNANFINVEVISDSNLRQIDYYLAEIGNHSYTLGYDTANNVTSRATKRYSMYMGGGSLAPASVIRLDNYTYGPHGHMLTHTISGFSGTETNTYYNEDKYFQKASATDLKGRVSTFDYGTMYDSNPGNRGNMLWARDARYSQTGAQYNYAYNQSGQKINESNLNNVVTEYTYGDTWGNLTRVVQDPGTGHLNRTTDMVYDVSGQVVEKTDPNRRTSTIDYNVLGQPEVAEFPATSNTPAETVTYSYGGNGRLDTITDNRGTTSFAYETGSDRVASITDPVTGTISFTYTPVGSIETKTLPGGGTWEYTYAAAANYCLLKDDPNSITEKLVAITDDQNRFVEVNIDATGYLRTAKFNQAFQNDTLVSYCLADYTLEGVPDTLGPASSSRLFLRKVKNTWNWKDTMGNWQSRTITQNNYTFDEMGNRLTNVIINSQGQTRTETYGYDELYRLASVNYGDSQIQGYTFDPMGNRLTKTDNVYGNETYIPNAANMTVTRNGLGYTYDTNGNTLTGGGRTNVWDSQNRLYSCAYNGNTNVFTYGADGLRRSSVTNGTRTDFALDGTMVVREMRDVDSDGDLESLATYFNGMYKRDDATGTLRWYIYDGLGSVLCEVDPSGNVTAERKYDVYGSVRSGQAGISKHKFVGQIGHPSEDETGLIYMRARYMDPALGKFVSEDTAGDGDNWYLYCGNNPVNFVDPTGNYRLDLGGGYWIRGDMKNGDFHVMFKDKSLCSWSFLYKKWRHEPNNGRLENGAVDAINEGPRSRDFKAKFGLTYDSVTQTFQSNPLEVIAILLIIAGEHDLGAQIDNINNAGGA